MADIVTSCHIDHSSIQQIQFQEIDGVSPMGVKFTTILTLFSRNVCEFTSHNSTISSLMMHSNVSSIREISSSEYLSDRQHQPSIINRQFANTTFRQIQSACYCSTTLNEAKWVTHWIITRMNQGMLKLSNSRIVRDKIQEKLILQKSSRSLWFPEDFPWRILLNWLQSTVINCKESSASFVMKSRTIAP
jgi:hypothetical protein